MSYSCLAIIEVDVSVDGPECLVIVECALSALKAVMFLSINETECVSVAWYGNEEQADDTSHMMGLLDMERLLLLDALAPRASPPYFRQVLYTLNSFVP
jgi:hypothetical protein